MGEGGKGRERKCIVGGGGLCNDGRGGGGGGGLRSGNKKGKIREGIEYLKRKEKEI